MKLIFSKAFEKRQMNILSRNHKTPIPESVLDFVRPDPSAVEAIHYCGCLSSLQLIGSKYPNLELLILCNQEGLDERLKECLELGYFSKLEEISLAGFHERSMVPHESKLVSYQSELVNGRCALFICNDEDSLKANENEDAEFDIEHRHFEPDGTITYRKYDVSCYSERCRCHKVLKRREDGFEFVRGVLCYDCSKD